MCWHGLDKDCLSLGERSLYCRALHAVAVCKENYLMSVYCWPWPEHCDFTITKPSDAVNGDAAELADMCCR